MGIYEGIYRKEKGLDPYNGDHPTKEYVEYLESELVSLHVSQTEERNEVSTGAANPVLSGVPTAETEPDDKKTWYCFWCKWSSAEGIYITKYVDHCENGQADCYDQYPDVTTYCSGFELEKGRPVQPS